jgi:hypothetical protein
LNKVGTVVGYESGNPRVQFDEPRTGTEFVALIKSPHPALLTPTFEAVVQASLSDRSHLPLLQEQVIQLVKAYSVLMVRHFFFIFLERDLVRFRNHLDLVSCLINEAFEPRLSMKIQRG